jgi:3-hydroxyisobutyrate dehydrogenase-like beta-hydroxyacid dehydrogenase
VAEALRARDVAMLDAPVSGSAPQVESGTLVIFVGGEESAYEYAGPLLSVLGKATFHMGGNGMGATMKLVVNALLGASLQALAEAIVLGERAGLEKSRLLEVLGQTAVVAPSHRLKLENVGREEYPVAFSLQLMHKDFGLIMALAHQLAVAMPATAVADQMCAAEVARGRQEDMSATIELMEELAGTVPAPH